MSDQATVDPFQSTGERNPASCRAPGLTPARGAVADGEIGATAMVEVRKRTDVVEIPSVDEMKRIRDEYAPQGKLPWWTSDGLGFSEIRPGEDYSQHEPIIVRGYFSGWRAPSAAA
jgi:hypothetical protein